MDLYLDEECTPFVGQLLGVVKYGTEICIINSSGAVLFDGVWQLDKDDVNLDYNAQAADVHTITIADGKLVIKIDEIKNI